MRWSGSFKSTRASHRCGRRCNPTADDGVYCTIAGKTALAIADHVCRNSAFNIAVGACAWDGGLVRSNPNPTGAIGLQEAVPASRY